MRTDVRTGIQTVVRTDIRTNMRTVWKVDLRSNVVPKETNEWERENIDIRNDTLRSED